MLTAEQIKQREWKTTASTAPIIMQGDAEKLIQLWRERIGEVEPPDFSDNWPVQLGNHCEAFVLDWHQRQTGHPLTERGRVVQHPELSYICATLDAFREHDSTVLDCKVCGAFRPLDEILAYYTPQVVVQMACREASRGSLLIMHGAAEPREYDIYVDADYERELWRRLAAFQLCVETLTPPAPLPRMVPPEQWRTVDLTSGPLPNWGRDMLDELAAWNATKEAADTHDGSAAAIKKLLPDDVGKLIAPDIRITRNRRGAVSIKRAES